MKIEEYLSAMKKRCSRRKYTNRPIDSKYVKQLEDNIALYNKESGLNMKLIIGNGGKLFDGFRKSYGLFVGVQNYIAMIGSKTLLNRMQWVYPPAGLEQVMIKMQRRNYAKGMRCWIAL